MAHLALERSELQLEVNLSVAEGQVVGVFGRSGAGKTTLLRCLAGLEACAGEVRVEGELWQGPGVCLPAHRRRVGYVFQDAALLPHLSVAENLTFAERRARGAPGISRGEAIEWLGLAGMTERKPRSLSGGERQRVALARALLSNPRLLLLDEPVASLDLQGRGEVLHALETVLERLQIPVLYVSHSPVEVARLTQRLIWLEGGRVRAEGPTSELLSGVELGSALGDQAVSVVEAQVLAHDAQDLLTALDCPWGRLWVPLQGSRSIGAQIRARIWARDVSLDLDPPGRSSALNHLEVEVLELREGDRGEVLVRLGSAGTSGAILARITRRSRDALALAPGLRVFARIKAISLAPEWSETSPAQAGGS